MLAPMQITKEWVDSFETGQEIPSCQVRAEWTKQGKPSQLTHLVTLKGAKKPNNYFYIELDSTPPDTTGGEFMCWHKPFIYWQLLSITLIIIFSFDRSRCTALKVLVVSNTCMSSCSMIHFIL